jgi:SMODS-associating 2TM, beta-strand rich effector domain
MSKRQLSVLLYSGFAVCAVLFLLHGVRLKKEWLNDASLAVSIVLFGAGLFDRVLWKWRPLGKLLQAVPNVSGTWKGIIQSSWIDPKKGRDLPPIEAYFSIHQTAYSFRLKTMTKEGASETVGSEVVKTRHGEHRVTAIYANEPEIAIRKRSPIHYGAVLLGISENAKELKGTYWTDRSTAGEMILRNKVNKDFPDFRAAKEAFDRVGL